MCFSLRLLLDVRPMAGRLLLALCQADESRVNVGICSLKLTHRGNTDQVCRQPDDLLIANQHLHSLCLTLSLTHTQSRTHIQVEQGNNYILIFFSLCLSMCFDLLLQAP